MSLLKRFFGENHPVKKETNEEELGVGSAATAKDNSGSTSAGVSEEIAHAAATDGTQHDASSQNPKGESTTTTPHEPTPEELEKQQQEMSVKAFLYMESSFRSQEISMREHLTFPRSNTEKFVTFRDVLTKVYPELSERLGTKAMLSHVDNGTVVAEGVLPLADFIDHSPFMFVFQNAEDGTTSVIDQITVLSFEIKAEDGKSDYLTLCVKPIGTTADSVYLRLSLLKPHEGKDDMLTSRSACFPEANSLIMVYDVLDPTEHLKNFEVVENAAVKNLKEHKPLDPYQDEVLHGMTGIHHPGYYVGYGKWLLEHKRFYDAYVFFFRAYNSIRPEFAAVPKEIKEQYFQACYGLGLCLFNLGFYEKAAYFLQLSMEGGQQFIGAYVESLALASHNRVNFFLNQLRNQASQSKSAAQELQRMENLVKQTEKNYQAPTSLDMQHLPLSYVLTNWFNAEPACVLGASITPTVEGEPGRTIQNGEEVWNLNLYDLKDSIVYIRYSRSQAETGIARDESILCHHNCIVLNLHSVETESGKDAVRVNMILPNFPNNDDKWVPGPCNVPIHTSFVIGTDGIEQTYTNKDLKEVFATSLQLKNENRIFEAMRGFEFIHRALKIDYTKVSATDEDEEMFFDSTFELGYCMVELGLFESATYYLDWAQEGYKVDYAREYVNCLCNNLDHRALDVINNLIKNMTKPAEEEYQEAYHYFISFMKRRKAFVLINRRMFDEAETLLKEMCEDPISKEYAEHELEFLSKIKR